MAKKPHKPRDPLPKEETPEQRFIRLANARTNAALSKIRLLGNLAGSGYRSTPEQRAKIIGALQDAVDRVNQAFIKSEKGGKPSFNIAE